MSLATFTRNQKVWVSGGVSRMFQRLPGGGYELRLEAMGISLQLTTLRLERQELKGELLVECDIVGARTVAGTLSSADFNVCSLRARQDRAQHLARRSCVSNVDWFGLLEELCQRVVAEERHGEPALILREVPEPAAEPEHDIVGIRLAYRHPTIVFGPGGTFKSLFALKALADLETRGVRTAFVDWELDAHTHRRRLAALTGGRLPDTRYIRCERPLVHEVPRLRALLGRDQIDYAVLDSAGFGADGPPESADVALQYFRAVRELGIGTLILAHVTKGRADAPPDDRMPFGSAFWHNSARLTWHFRRGSASPDGRVHALAAFCRKHNFGPEFAPRGLTVDFSHTGQIEFRATDVTSIEEVAGALPLWQRIQAAVRTAPRTVKEIADELGDAKPESIERTARRHKDLFSRVSGSDGVIRVALAGQVSL
jgi:hypothetical protein